jgi:polysaccharide deacetylase family protein (PEP-CTERM system associated)
VHCLTFDIEEHFQVSRFDSPIRRRHWSSFESRVTGNTCRVLDLLARTQTTATFFVLGWVAERHPALIKQISECGHEIACHGYNHELVTAQTPELFREDVKKSKALLEDLIGSAVLGYRAPAFTITNETLWALPILVEEGFVYDASIVPIRHDYCGIGGAMPSYHLRHTEAGPIWEVPPSTTNLLGIRIPVAGGSYFRLLPFELLRYLLKGIERQQQPLVMYFHPWELDPYQPRMEGPLLSRLFHYANLHRMEARLADLLSSFRFGPIMQQIGLISAMTVESPGPVPLAPPAQIAQDVA